MTKNQIKEMMAKTGQQLTYEDNNTLQYENDMFGEDITFEFDNNGFFTRVYS